MEPLWVCDIFFHLFGWLATHSQPAFGVQTRNCSNIALRLRLAALCSDNGLIDLALSS